MRIIGCLVVSFLVACGGGSDSPSEKCDDLVDLVCDRLVECVPAAGTHAQCVGEVQSSLNCDAAASVTENYTPCLMQLRSMSCASLFPNNTLALPADCSGVILIGE